MIEIAGTSAPVGNILNGLNIFIFATYLLIIKIINSSYKIAFFYFQLATRGIESVVYKKLIAPVKNDLPVSHLAGYRRVCDDHKYAYFGPNYLNTKLLLPLPCQVVPLPEPNYIEKWAYITSINSPYRGLVNWR
jgi:hypothetical protein